MKFYKFSNYFFIGLAILIVGLIIYFEVDGYFEMKPDNYFVSGYYYCDEYNPTINSLDSDNISHYNLEATKYYFNINEITSDDYQANENNCVFDNVSKKYYKLEMIYKDPDSKVFQLDKLSFFKAGSQASYSSSSYDITITPGFPGSNKLFVYYNGDYMTFILNNN